MNEMAEVANFFVQEHSVACFDSSLVGIFKGVVQVFIALALEVVDEISSSVPDIEIRLIFCDSNT